MKRTIFIGDVHGCLHELKLMIDKIKPKKQDRVILVGDLINRGPDPVGVVKYVYENGFESLMGNHEYEYLKEYQTEKKYQILYNELGKKLHDWLSQRPYWIEDENFIAVHAGLHPDYELQETPLTIFLFIRAINQHFINSHYGIPWYMKYKGKKKVIYGHWARKGLTIRSNTIGLDSGCVYGRFLSAYILEENRIIQIPAKKTYYIPPSLKGL
ncbi:MAG: metallophosphoesterase [Leptospiraceae bacterium]|nr:metallophosphoesterase [Leptospiraceae bacterium]MDW7976511.1 metallophosphoesterase [Leptospiraceae bacterium]